MINAGKILFEEEKDFLLEKFRVVKGDVKYLSPDIKSLMLHFEKSKYGFTGISDNASKIKSLYPDVLLEKASIEDITPRECSSGGKQKLLGISKRGNKYIRKLLIQGARILCIWWNRNMTKEGQWRRLWLQQLTARRGKFVAAVAQANKTARIIWNVLARGVEYDENRKEYSY